MIIDNETRDMATRFQELLPGAERLDIAVGYFFISGFEHIMDHLQRIESEKAGMIRILTSPHTDRPTRDALLAANEPETEAERLSGTGPSPADAAARYEGQFRSEVEHMRQTAGQRRAVLKLADLIKRKKLQIRIYTREQLHAKLYLFRIAGAVREESIIGSSNMSTAGLRTHAELNFVTNDSSHYRDFEGWFKRHWDDEGSVDFTAEAAAVLDRSWAAGLADPRAMARRILEEECPRQGNVEHGKIRLYDFQKEAVSMALQKVGDHGGVIIADVVGTGKTYMGAAVINHLLQYDIQYPLVICPPRLEDMWREDIQAEYSMPISVLPNSRLDDLDKYRHCDAVLIDESHAFKTEGAARFRKLAEFMESRTSDTRVIMLTATPITNSVFDLRSQLKLFPMDMMERIPPIEGTEAPPTQTKLDRYFHGMDPKGRDVPDEHKEKVRELLKYVLVRRTRLRILEKSPLDEDGNHYMPRGEERGYFPRAELSALPYDADITYEGRFSDIESEIAGLTMARYTFGRYMREEFKSDKPYDNLARITTLGGIMRILLLKRLESSIMAFASSVDRLRRGHEWFLGHLREGRIPVGGDFERMLEAALGDETDKLEEIIERQAGVTESDYKQEAFRMDEWIDDVATDIKRLDAIAGFLGDKGAFQKRDDKIHELRRLVDDTPGKILVFTESAVTAEYVYGYIRGEFPERIVAKLDSKKSQKEITDAVRRFAPRYNPPGCKAGEEIDILVSTDILSEGLNLQQGDVLVNYDFHWNPVRLIQRNGRIDRLVEEPKSVMIYNFLTTPDVEEGLQLRDRVRTRIQTIRDILGIGTGSAVLEGTEPLESEDVCDIYMDDAGVLEDGGLVDLGDEDPGGEDLGGDPGERLLLGGRAATGEGVLYAACRADDRVVDGSGRRYIETTFRRYYRVSAGRIEPVRRSEFIGTAVSLSRGRTLKSEPERYDEMISRVWDRFDRDMRSSLRYVPQFKFQLHFARMLDGMATRSNARRVAAMRRFVTARMVQQAQPYTDLLMLHKRRGGMGPDDMLLELEAIHARRGDPEFTKEMKRPLILYSMMVDDDDRR